MNVIEKNYSRTLYSVHSQREATAICKCGRLVILCCGNWISWFILVRWGLRL